jgi:FkbM family methyltransferase
MKLRLHLIRLVHFAARMTGQERCLDLFNFTLPVTVRGFRYFVPRRGELGRSLVQEAPHEMDELYARILRNKKGLFLDVGCNEGQTFLLWLKHRGPGLRYVAVDPQPRCCAYVGVLSRKNAVNDAVILCAGLAESPGLATLYCIDADGADSDMASMEPILLAEAEYKSRILVPTVTGDALVESVASEESVAVIKIDVEGFEHGVLEGFQQTITRDRPLILCEFMGSGHPDPARRQERRNQIAASNRFLKNNGYDVFHAHRDGNLAPLDGLPAYDFSRDHFRTAGYDFLLVPEELSGEFGVSPNSTQRGQQ